MCELANPVSWTRSQVFPSFQWAQNDTSIFLSVKWGHLVTAPWRAELCKRPDENIPLSSTARVCLIAFGFGELTGYDGLSHCRLDRAVVLLVKLSIIFKGGFFCFVIFTKNKKTDIPGGEIRRVRIRLFLQAKGGITQSASHHGTLWLK